tara:strand:- start:47577 stop:47711 length:135 start_codon:yes stop_codon:yes gene_type:complete
MIKEVLEFFVGFVDNNPTIVLLMCILTAVVLIFLEVKKNYIKED